MAYTVKELADISKVTERTLRWYDKKGLLSPAYYGANGYRYYEEEQLLLLQQILFFRELDFSLDEIKRVITGDNFDKINALTVQKKALNKNLDRTKTLIKTLEKTILHIRGKIVMEDKKLYEGFQAWSKGKGPESYFIGQCDNLDEVEDDAERLVLKSARKNEGEKRDKSYWDSLEHTYSKIYGDLAISIDEGLKPDSDEVQKLIEEHHKFAQKFHNCTQEVYHALAKLYSKKEEYRKQLEIFHPKLPGFISKGMEVYAKNRL